MLGRRSLVPFVALLLGAPLLAACDPPPPPPVFTVDSDGTTADVAPGDGNCDDGTGACTLPAAIQEANALGLAEIVVPSGVSPTDLDVRITGSLTIRGESTEDLAGAVLPNALLRVEPGAVLSLVGIDLEYGGLRVQGGLLADRIAFGHLTVEAAGMAVVRNAFALTTFQFPLIDNKGVLHIQSSTVLALHPTATAIVTATGGDTRLRSTLVVADSSAACTGTTPTSDGYNASDDATCGLTATGDLPSLSFPSHDFFPERGTPLHEAVPLGEAGCGTEVLLDIVENPRPSDDDYDGVAECEIGAWEAGPGSPFS
jgi:hypothetical protein